MFWQGLVLPVFQVILLVLRIQFASRHKEEPLQYLLTRCQLRAEHRLLSGRGWWLLITLVLPSTTTRKPRSHRAVPQHVFLRDFPHRGVLLALAHTDADIQSLPRASYSWIL